MAGCLQCSVQCASAMQGAALLSPFLQSVRWTRTALGTPQAHLSQEQERMGRSRECFLAGAGCGVA